MKRLLMVVLGLIASFLVTPSAVALSSLGAAPTVYVYNFGAHPVETPPSTGERGPPATTYSATAAPDPVGNLSHGPAARSRTVGAGTNATYDRSAQFAPGDNGRATTQAAARGREADSRLVPRAGVAAKSETAVIGKVADLEKGVGANEYTLLDQLPNMGSPKLNWKQNSGVLRKVMSRGQPIRDASVGADGQLIQYPGSFLNVWFPPNRGGLLYAASRVGAAVFS